MTSLHELIASAAALPELYETAVLHESLKRVERGLSVEPGAFADECVGDRALPCVVDDDVVDLLVGVTNARGDTEVWSDVVLGAAALSAPHEDSFVDERLEE